MEKRFQLDRWEAKAFAQELVAVDAKEFGLDPERVASLYGEVISVLIERGLVLETEEEKEDE